MLVFMIIPLTIKWIFQQFADYAKSVFIISLAIMMFSVCIGIMNSCGLISNALELQERTEIIINQVFIVIDFIALSISCAGGVTWGIRIMLGKPTK